jgi:hypothetical protein
MHNKTLENRELAQRARQRMEGVVMSGFEGSWSEQKLKTQRL